VYNVYDADVELVNASGTITLPSDNLRVFINNDKADGSKAAFFHVGYFKK
jgi:hypothetical protein